MGTIITFNGDSLHTYIEQDVAPHAQHFLPSKKKKKLKANLPLYILALHSRSLAFGSMT